MNNKKYTFIIFGVAFVLLLVLGVVVLLERNNSPTHKGISPEEYQDKAQTNIVQESTGNVRFIAFFKEGEGGEEKVGGLYQTMDECSQAIEDFKDAMIGAGERALVDATIFGCREHNLVGTEEEIMAIEATAPAFFAEIIDQIGLVSGSARNQANNTPTTAPVAATPTPTPTPKGRIKWEIAIYKRDSGERLVSTQQFDTREDCESMKDQFLSGLLAESGQQHYIDDYQNFGCEEMWWNAD